MLKLSFGFRTNVPKYEVSLTKNPCKYSYLKYISERWIS
ncbi:hypothetical protein SAMN06296036_123116 [Pseudobacteriovorax antillogorgiicola]|uniref:Uncharacterized protein n=1 Tax=Pseudobacteriovorax antillogorgiicola TaxID=1513793 RepID=A0A1Y6CNZ9_9BACT|nr:hypothetical protein EDD56_123116 [Pseudobacteriovorax antillogorgiicola]SMF67498.1 hypothetical protein SAMN06296036_123116 [Pseudobacteriovorax antillogorgiicola]